MRIGHGFDAHRFGPGDAVVLCGVRIPFDRGLEAHSDTVRIEVRSDTYLVAGYFSSTRKPIRSQVHARCTP